MQAPDHIQPPQDTVPQSLHRLGELARNLWWSWNQPARQLFESIDPTLWFLTHHNPVQLLSGVKPERFVTLAGDPNFVRQYSAVLRAFDEYLSNLVVKHLQFLLHIFQSDKFHRTHRFR